MRPLIFGLPSGLGPSEWRRNYLRRALAITAQGAVSRNTVTGVAFDAAARQWDRKKDTLAMAEHRARQRAREMLSR